MNKDLKEETLNAIEDVWKAVTDDRYTAAKKRKGDLDGDITSFTFNDLLNPQFADDEVGRWGQYMYDACVDTLARNSLSAASPAIGVMMQLLRFMAAYGCSLAVNEEKAELIKVLQGCHKHYSCRPILRAAERGHDVICTHDPQCEEDEESEYSDALEDFDDEEEPEVIKKCIFVEDEAEETDRSDTHVSRTASIESIEEEVEPPKQKRRM